MLPHSAPWTRSISIAGVIGGIFLIGIGSSHFLHEHQSSGDARAPGYTGIVGRHLDEVSEAELKIGSHEPQLHFASRITAIVHNTTYHCAPRDYAFSIVERFALRAKLASAENSSWVNGPTSRNQLRCGYCHQRAIAVAQILRANGIKAWAFGIRGHVVTRIDLGDATYVSDPDYGIAPFRYDVSRDIVQDTLRAYETSVVVPGQPSPPDTSPGDLALTPEQIASFMASTGDNEFYSSPERWDAIDDARVTFARVTSALAMSLIFAGLLMLAGSIWMRRRPPISGGPP